jgi:hypothetical protein
MEIATTGNLAPGNTLQNAINLARPALLAGFLAAARGAEPPPDSEVGTASSGGGGHHFSRHRGRQP